MFKKPGAPWNGVDSLFYVYNCYNSDESCYSIGYVPSVHCGVG